nr:MAG TPA: hypothetical protein [Caudoviricetes sp.]
MRSIRACVCALRGRYALYCITFILLRNLYDTSDTDTRKHRLCLTFSCITWCVTALIRVIQVCSCLHYRFDTGGTRLPTSDTQ